MFSIKQEQLNNLEKYDHKNCVYTAGISRPSKSVINCDLYRNYFKLNLDIIDEFSSINIKKNYYLLKELICVFKLDISDLDTLSISYNTIIINEFEKNNKNLVFYFDNDISLRNILVNINEIIPELKDGDFLVINYHNLFIYPALELLAIISKLFVKVKIYYCKLIKQNILYCKEFNHDTVVIEFIDNIIKNWNNKLNIRQFGISIHENILNNIKSFNNSIFKYYIELNNNFSTSTLEDKEYFLKNYIKKYSINNSSITCINTMNCNHDIIELNLMKCYVCKKCYDLFQIY